MKEILLSNRKIQIHDTAEPSIRKDTDVLVQICYASICGYELMIYRGLASAGINSEVGHEVSGIVLETGKKVTNFKPGDNVVVSLNTACGDCSMCREGRPDYCLNMHIESHGMKERIVCPHTSLHHLHNLSLREGCLIEPLTMAMCCVSKANLSGGERVLILGGGAMGLLILKLLLLYPIREVIVADPHLNKRNLALSFGAAKAFDPYAEGYLGEVNNYSSSNGYDVVIEASGNPASAKIAFHFVSRGGHLIFFGLYGMNFELPLNLFNLYWTDANICSVLPSTVLYPNAIKLAPRLNLSELITAEYPFEQVEDAFREKDRGNHAKVILSQFPT